MRIAIVAESFLPQVNGVVNSCLRVLEHLRAQGHDALVIAPAARPGEKEIAHYQGFRIARVPAVDVPMINSLPIGVPMPKVLTELKLFRPDVVHLASPFVLGGAGALAAKALNIPCVAVYQTDVAGFANNYKLKALSKAAWTWTRRLHNICDLTLAPSSVSIAELEAHAVQRVKHWGRGVDTALFHPSKRSEELRQAWLQGGDASGDPARPILGFVGRLAAEKSVERLAVLSGRSDVQLVIVGDGPERADLERRMPDAVFTGALYGEDLATAYASMDIFTHAGQWETFCQTIQEAQASGLATIGPALGGPVDLITPGQNGYLLEPATFERDLPGAFEAIAADLPRFQEAAFQAVQGKTWTGLCTQLMGYYKEAIRNHSLRQSIQGRFSLSLAAG